MRKVKYRLYAGKCSINGVESFVSDVNHFAQFNDVYMQVLNAEMICGSLHIESAIILMSWVITTIVRSSLCNSINKSMISSARLIS